jgi:hypothetical protein
MARIGALGKGELHPKGDLKNRVSAKKFDARGMPKAGEICDQARTCSTPNNAYLPTKQNRFWRNFGTCTNFKSEPNATTIYVIAKHNLCAG